MNPVYEVTVIEYEAGVPRANPTEIREFPSREAAEAYAATVEQGGTSEWYYRAEIRQIG